MPPTGNIPELDTVTILLEDRKTVLPLRGNQQRLQRVRFPLEMRKLRLRKKIVR